MDHFKTFKKFLLEFQKQDISLLESIDDYFTIGFEIEMDTDNRRIGSLSRPPKEITESREITYSIQDRKKLMDIKFNFPNFWKKYFDILSWHYDESVASGIEMVTTPFKSISKAKEFIIIFFEDYKNQKDWMMDEKTSIHINIGVNGKIKPKWNVIKCVIMLSDDYSFKNIESRKYSGYCNSIKDELFRQWSSGGYGTVGLLETEPKNNIKEIEAKLSKNVFHISRTHPKHYGINFSKLENQNYIEFRFVGGNELIKTGIDSLNSKIVIDKLMYFLYIVYLMSTKYKQEEYHHKLMTFVNKIKTTIGWKKY
jgi:hypothetical protein